MKRPVITKLCVFLLLIAGGAIVNVAVAWGWLIVGPRRSSTPAAWQSAPWPMPVSETWSRPANVRIICNAGMTQSDSVGRSYDGMVRMAMQHFVQAGWPARSVYRVVQGRGGSVGLSRWQPQSVREGIEVPAIVKALDRNDRRFLPAMPIWPGFAINTLFYAAILWALFAAPFALRRRLRIKRGLCPKCAYDLRGSASSVCPECGAADAGFPSPSR